MHSEVNTPFLAGLALDLCGRFFLVTYRQLTHDLTILFSVKYHKHGPLIFLRLQPLNENTHLSIGDLQRPPKFLELNYLRAPTHTGWILVFFNNDIHVP